MAAGERRLIVGGRPDMVDRNQDIANMAMTANCNAPSHEGANPATGN